MGYDEVDFVTQEASPVAGNKNSGDRNAVYRGPQCSGHTVRGEQCHGPAMANGKCRMHGGASPKGAASASFRHGRYGKYLGPVLGAMVADALTDPDRMGMESELALLDTRLGLLVKQLEPGITGGATADWAALAKAMDDFRTAQARKSVPAMHDAMTRVQSIVDQGAGEGLAWKEVAELIDRRRVLVESEERRAVAAGKAVPTEVVMGLVAGMSRIMLDEVTDPRARGRITERIASLVHGKKLPLAQLPRRVLAGATE